MSSIQNYSALIVVAKQMESDLGLSDLSEAERLVVAAISILQQRLPASEFVPTRAIMQQELCSKMTAPTFYRALKELLRREAIAVPEGRKKGLYRLY
jgi:uncharacterized protein (DUF2267 family)